MNPPQLRLETCSRFSAWGLEANKHLPLLESASDLRPKSPSQVAARATAAGYVAARCFGAPQDKILPALERFTLSAHLSEEEKTLLASPEPQDEAVAFHGWVVESIQFMAWALGLTVLEHFAQCPDTLASLFPKAGEDPEEFIGNAKLRPIGEILQEADTLYMLHWLAVEMNLTGRSDDRIVLPRISFRRHAADWIVGVAEEWDDVPMDT